MAEHGKRSTIIEFELLDQPLPGRTRPDIDYPGLCIPGRGGHDAQPGVPSGTGADAGVVRMRPTMRGRVHGCGQGLM